VDLDSVAEELYALPPEEFVAARDTAAKQAADRELSTAIKALRRPTASAHAVNQLVRDEPATFDDLLVLGDELRTAMSGRGGDVRQLTEQRRALVAELVAGVPDNVRDDVTATLEAATADPQLGEAVRSGRLVKPLRYAGFGEFPDLGDVVATPIPRRTAAQKTAAKKTAKKSPAKAAKEPKPESGPDLTAMRQQVLELSGAADDAQRRYDEAARAVVELRARLEQAEKVRAEAHRAARAAHADAERARRDLGRAERA